MGTEDFQTPKELRDAYDSLVADQAKTRQELADMQKENKLLAAKEAFREAKYSPNMAELFVSSVEGDITVDAVHEFVAKYDLPPMEVELAKAASESEPVGEENQQNVEADDSDLSLMAGGTRSGEGGQQAADAQKGTISRADWEELAKSDPVAARQAVDSGKVLLRSDNFYIRNARSSP